MFILHKDIKDQRFLISDLFLYVGIFEENNTLKEGKAMKFVIQRVKEASVKVDDEYTGKIKKGYLVLIGVGQEDTKEEADKSLPFFIPPFFWLYSKGSAPLLSSKYIRVIFSS